MAELSETTPSLPPPGESAPLEEIPGDAPPALSAEQAQEAEAAYHELLPLATALPEAALTPYRGLIHIARYNADRAFEEVFKQEARLQAELSPSLLDLARQAPKAALAAVFAARRVEHLERGPDGERLALMAEGRLLRRRVLKVADACAEYGLLPFDRVEKIKRGKGAVDTANDCVELAALLREYAPALAGKTPIPEGELDRCAQVGTQLLKVIKPHKAKGAPEPSEEELAVYELRDRFWTLLVQRHDILWRLGALLYGQRVTEQIPPLLSQESTKTPDTPEVKEARAQAREAREQARAAEKEARQKEKAAAEVAREARKKKK